MNQLIIPWPSQCNGDFKRSVDFLEEIGFPPMLFFLDFISCHGSSKWATDYGEVEKWIEHKLDKHFCLLAEIVSANNFDNVDAAREMNIYYQRTYSMVTGVDVDYQDCVYALTAVLNNHFAYMVLPKINLTDLEYILDFKDMRNGYASITLSEKIGDLINEFYQPGTGKDKFNFTLPHQTRNHEAISVVH